MNARVLKIASCFVLFAAAAAFAAESWGFDVLADFAVIGRYDAAVWAVMLMALSLLQVALLGASACLKCRVWGDFVLQLSGLALLIIGTAFAAEYPPFSWMMGVCPILGLVFIFAGRVLGDKTRGQLRGQNE